MAHELLNIPSRISFYWTMTELFNADSMRTLFKAENKATDEGKSLLDALALTEDESDTIYVQILSDGVYDVFLRFLKYTTGITDAIKFNKSYTPTGGVAANSVVLQIVNNDNYNANYLDAVDMTLEKCIRYYFLREWFMLKDLDNDAKKADYQYQNNLNNLLRHSVELKKASISF